MATSVFVRGFDFGTSEDDIIGHCSEVGGVVGVEMWGKGAAVVTYSSKGEALAAVKSLNGTTIGANTRYIDVKLNDETKGNKGKQGGGGVKREFVKDGEGCRVFVRGFDFGTTDEVFEEHMAAAGTIQRVGWVTKGSAVVCYSSPEEAQNAVEQLQGTTLPGNSRYIDVILKEGDDTGFPPNKRARTSSPGGGKGSSKGGGKGAGTWVFIPEGSTIPALNGGRSKGAGKSGGKKAKGQEDPPGSGRVFVRGFDFGTSNEAFERHMKKAGPIHTVHWVTKGSAVVVYKSRAGAQKAANNLNGTTLAGNSRYMDVILKDSE